MSNAHDILTKLFPIFYHDISGSTDPQIESWDCPVYEHAMRTIKALLEIRYPDIPADFTYDLCVDAGEYHTEDTIRHHWSLQTSTDNEAA